LHYFRRRFRPREVSALFLWQSLDRTPVAGRERQPLRSSSSLWLELLAAACLAFALAGPRAGSSRSEHLVIVLDSSASLSAVIDGASLRERAVSTVEERVCALNARARVSLIVSGSRPTLLAGPAAFASEALGRLHEFEPRSTHHDLSRSVALALELSGGKQVLVITSRYEPEAFPDAVELIALGKPAPNVAFVHASRTRERDPRDGATGSVERIFLSVANWGSAAATTNLTLSSAGRVLETRPLTIPARGKTAAVFELSPGAPLVEARLDDDALAIDNLVRLAPVLPRKLTLYCDLSAELRAQLNLSDPSAGEDNLARWSLVVPDSRVVARAEEAHFAISAAPVGSNATACLVIETSAGESRDFIGPFLMEKRAPALEGVVLDGVIWSAPNSPSLVGAPLVSAGSEVLLSEEREAGRAIWRLKLDPARATLVRSPDWPILLWNLAEERRAQLPGFSRSTLQVGESVVYRAGSELTQAAAAQAMYVLTAPDGSTREIAPRSELWIDSVEQPGVYALALGTTKLGEFAVSFVDGRESDLSTLQSGNRPSSAVMDAPEIEFSWIEQVLAALALGFLLLDYYVLSRSAARLAHFEPLAGNA
jgi:hypothetical protein